MPRDVDSISIGAGALNNWDAQQIYSIDQIVDLAAAIFMFSALKFLNF